MAFYQKDFGVANPSPYERSDYVQIDLDKLQVPAELDEKSLTLYQLNTNNEKQEILFQIDYPFGRDVGSRVMTFLSAQTPPVRDDYSEKAATFLLEAKNPKQVPAQQNLKVGHYYSIPKRGEPEDGFNLEWDISRQVKGVKLFNGTFEIYFELLSSSSRGDLSYAGSATSTLLPIMKNVIGIGEILSPYHYKEHPEKLWGQLRELVFYPLPWEHKQFYRIKFPDEKQEYEIIWSKSGPVRAIVTLKSEPMTISYDGRPFFNDKRKITVYLYRVIYVYPNQNLPYYVEELYALTDKEKKFLSFRPYYFSKVPPAQPIPKLEMVEQIPNYFTVWKNFGPLLYFGYGFAADVHIRWVKIKGDEIYWRLPLNQNCRCVHYFMFEQSSHFNPFHIIGHSGWYEKIFKPLKPFDLSLSFPPPLVEDEV